jgi:mono/diheme cytochrome c family protein
MFVPASSKITRFWPIALLSGVAILAIIGAAALVIFSGLYNIAADVPHSQPIYWLMQTARDRSIAGHAASIVAPDDLADPERVAAGAGLYAEMCSGCHLAPGMERTEISRGLYPRAPELRRGVDLTPAEEFWVAKHGIKMTGMPAWGVTHSDKLLWDVVAFLQKLPDLSPDEYQALSKSAPKTHDEMMQEMGMGHGHDGHPHE